MPFKPLPPLLDAPLHVPAKLTLGSSGALATLT